MQSLQVKILDERMRNQFWFTGLAIYIEDPRYAAFILPRSISMGSSWAT